jgi:hypothetical protein
MLLWKIFASCALLASLTSIAWADHLPNEAWPEWLRKENEFIKNDPSSPLWVISLKKIKTGETLYLTAGKSPHHAEWLTQKPDRPHWTAFKYDGKSVTYLTHDKSSFEILPPAGLKTNEAFLINTGVPKYDGINLWVKDAANPKVANFKGLDFFPFSPAWIVGAKLEKLQQPEATQLSTSTGELRPAFRIGKFRFIITKKEMTLDAFTVGKPDSLELVVVPFNDKTNGVSTYSAGRSLELNLQNKDLETAELDFNRATQPYCAYVHGYSCLMPPPSNRLSVAVTAGQRWSKSDQKHDE